MTRKKPAACITPKKDAEDYCLTGRDLDHLLHLVKEANAILSYYINMPENLSGELSTKATVTADYLYSQTVDLKNTLAEIYYK